MGSLTCATILTCILHTKARQASTNLHKYWLGRTENGPSPCLDRESNPRQLLSLVHQRRALTTEPRPLSKLSGPSRLSGRSVSGSQLIQLDCQLPWLATRHEGPYSLSDSVVRLGRNSYTIPGFTGPLHWVPHSNWSDLTTESECFGAFTVDIEKSKAILKCPGRAKSSEDTKRNQSESGEQLLVHSYAACTPVPAYGKLNFLR